MVCGVQTGPGPKAMRGPTLLARTGSDWSVQVPVHCRSLLPRRGLSDDFDLAVVDVTIASDDSSAAHVPSERMLVQRTPVRLVVLVRFGSCV